MGIRFDALSETERAAVGAFVEAEYDKLVFQQPGTCVSQNAQTDPKQWQDALRELIAGDPERVVAITEAANGSPTQSAGFTLIEMSIVLVIIGLIVGGVLVGQNLIASSQVRATITQIEKYNTAANTFYGKYGALPGDLNAQVASTFGFTARGPYAGEGDGNGVIEGVNANAAGHNVGIAEGAGETVMFWVDLSTVNLIEGNFNTASPTTPAGSAITGTALNNYFPQAKLGNGNYFYVYSGSYTAASPINYFGISAIQNIPTSPCLYCIASNPGLTVAQASAIDTKIDDGLPQSGNVTATYLNYLSGAWWAAWAAGGGAEGTNFNGQPTTYQTPGSSTTCYDNGNNGTLPQHYSIEISNGSNVNCALSFKMQAGD
jgi:prepilin-type N-terminal cleavage/methylation domain-containing protein